jgi:putative salt-induced outer membrane protein YdiY
MRALARGAISCAFLAIVVTAAGAQQPDTAVKASAPKAWKAAVDLGFNAASGNSSLTYWHSALTLSRLQKQLAEFEWSVSFDYGHNRGNLAEQRLTSGAKFDYLPHNRVSPFTFVNAEQDEVRKVDLQAYGGAGLKYTFWKSGAGKASISAAMLYNYETFTTSRVTLVAAPSEGQARWSLRFKGTRKFGKALELDNTTFYQPVYDVVGDYNFSATSSIKSKATSHLSLVIQHLYRRDSTPQEGVNPVDQRLTGGLRVEF